MKVKVTPARFVACCGLAAGNGLVLSHLFGSSPLIAFLSGATSVGLYWLPERKRKPKSAMGAMYEAVALDLRDKNQKLRERSREIKEQKRKLEVLADRVKELHADLPPVQPVFDAPSDLEKELLIGPGSNHAAAQATIDKIDAELARAARVEQQKLDAIEQCKRDTAEIIRRGLLTPEEREREEDWAAFGGPPRKLSTEELAEVRERVRPVNGDPAAPDFKWGSHRGGFRTRMGFDTGGLLIDGETHVLHAWGQPNPVRTYAGFTVEQLAMAVSNGVFSEEFALQILETHRGRD